MDVAKEHVSAGLDVAKENMKTGLEFTKDGVVAGYEVTKEKATEAGTLIKDKLDETGITDGVKTAGSAAYSAGLAGAGFVNSKIEANPTLASAKAATTQKASQAANYAMSWFGYGGAAGNESAAAGEAQAAASEEQKEAEE